MVSRTSRFRISGLVGVGLVFVGVAHVGVHAAEKFKLSSVSEYRKCIDQDASPEVCLGALEVFVKSHPAEAFAAGKAVRATMTHSAAIPFFAKAFTRNGDKVRCSDEDVTMALLSALSLPASYKEMVSPALTILFDRCWEETHGAVLGELEKSAAEGAMVENLCPKLRERKQPSAACEKRQPAAAAAVVESPKWKELDPRSISVEDPLKVFRGGEGKVVSLAKVKGSDNAYLIRFHGFRGPWNGRVVLHREQPVDSSSQSNRRTESVV